jgi:hypothetical protein
LLRLLGPLAAVALAALSVAPALAADSSAAAARAEHQRIVNYWTSERVAAAKPRDFVRTSQGFKPAARPGGSGAVTGASYTGGGPVTQSVGKVFFHMAGGDWQCSGSVANDGNRSGSSLVLTAGHCAVDETTGEFATNWVFIPAWDEQPATFSTACSASKYGCWTATALVAHHSFANAGGFNEQATRYDFAFAVVGAGGKSGTQLDGQFTAFNVTINTVSAGAQMAAFGFPAAGKYHGNDLTWCSGPIFTDASNNNFTWGMACDMTGGSSGGGWLANFSNGNGALGSLNSYGYSGVKNMYGPKFNNDTQAVYTAAKSATRNTLV